MIIIRVLLILLIISPLNAALPTTNLTARFDASVTTKLFTTFSGSGVHTGTPADGDLVEVAEDMGDGSVTDIIFAADPSGVRFRSSVPLMKNSCLDFSASPLSAYTQTAGASRVFGDLFTASDLTVAIVFYAETIADTDAAVYDNNTLFATSYGSDYFAVSARDVAGAKKIRANNYDGNHDATGDVAIAEGRTYIAIVTHTGGNLTMLVIDDTGAEASSTVASGNTGATTTQLHMGGNAAGAQFDGRIGELVAYNAAVTGTDLTNLKDYFKDKWMTIAGGAAPAPIVPRRIMPYIRGR